MYGEWSEVISGYHVTPNEGHVEYHERSGSARGQGGFGFG